MGLILRVDVDKPFGRKTISERIKSKLREDFWFPAINCWGYLKATEKFIKYCNGNGIQGVFYFRNCTAPGKKITKLLREGNHQIGFHAENTRSLSTFKKELERFKEKLSGAELSSFTKHGSGDIKLGRNHYHPYEPDKYRLWAKEINLAYIYGNEIIDSTDDFSDSRDYYPKMFWIHNEYRNESFDKIEDVIRYARSFDIPVIIHPSNYYANDFVNREFNELVSRAKRDSISWNMIVKPSLK